MRIRGVFALFVLLSFLLMAGSASAAPPVLLTVGDVSQHPTATWSLPSGVQAQVVEVATSPTTGSDGYFFFENVEAFSVPQATDTSWTYGFQLAPGTYYVHVAGYDTTCGACPVREFSNVLTLVIAAPPPPPPPPPLPPPPPPPPPVAVTPPVITSVVGDGKGLITVTWSLPAGVTSRTIQIASDATIGAAGFFNIPSQVDFGVLTAAQTSHTSSIPQAPGTYYVHVSGYQPAFSFLDVWSPPTAVTIPARTPPAVANPPVITKPPAAKKSAAPNLGNSRSLVRARSKAYRAAAKSLATHLTACSTIACLFRQVTLFGVKQVSYEATVGTDTSMPAPCGSAARKLIAQVRKSETATLALLKAVGGARLGAKTRRLARVMGMQASRAITFSHAYVSACG